MKIDPRHTLQSALRVQEAVEPEAARRSQVFMGLEEDIATLVADLDFALSECSRREPDFAEDFAKKAYMTARQLKKLREQYGDEAVPGAVAAYERYEQWLAEPVSATLSHDTERTENR